MNILIIGAGAIGIALGATLGKTGNEISYLASRKTGEKIENGGIHRTGLFGNADVPAEGVKVYYEYPALPENAFDYVCVCAKTMANEEIAGKLYEARNCLKDGGVIVIMQNGWNNDAPYRKYFPEEKVYLARVITGFQRTSPNTSNITVHTAPLLIGSLYGCSSEAVRPLAEAINAGGIPSQTSEEVGKALWAKMLYNTTLNPLGAVLGVPYGKLAECDSTVRIMNTLIHETFAVMKAAGYSTFWDTPEEYIEEFYRKLVPDTAGHCSSTLQDIRKQQKTEIETLTGKIIELGVKHGVPVPTHQTLYDLVVFMETGYLRKQELRRKTAEIKNSLEEGYFAEADAAIAEYVINSEDFRKSGTVFAYINMEREPATRKIIEAAWSAGKTVCVPKCIKKPEMLAVRLNSFDELKTGSYGIREPEDITDLVDIDQIDMGIIPCVSADLKGERIGHGAGYYDVFMQNAGFKKVCLCYEKLLSKKIPMDDHDQKMDVVVTESGYHIIK